MQSEKIAKLDTAKWLKERYPNKKFPKLVIRLLRHFICEGQINKLFADAPGKKNMEFIDSCMRSMQVSCQVVGMENLPSDGSKLIFASNHPQGGIEAICIAHILGNRYNGKLKFYANELLCVLEPLKEMFLPINRNRLQSKQNVKFINEFYQSDCHLITFPAGVTSFKKRGKIIDHPWRKGFLKAAVQHHRNVVPIYFEARNSTLFYIIENLRKSIRFPINFEVCLFAKEFFKQRGKSFTLYIGKPIGWENFDESKPLEEWVEVVRKEAYGLSGR
jgi:hypothetical protein